MALIPKGFATDHKNVHLEYASFGLAASGDILAAPTSGNVYYIYGFALSQDRATGDELVYVESDGGTDHIGTDTGEIGAPSLVLPVSPTPWFITDVDKALSLIISGSTPFVGGCIVYAEVTP